MTRFLRTRRPTLANRRGFTLIELMIVVAIIGILAAIAMPLYAGVQRKARIAKAQADIRTIASTMTAYSAHCGGLPSATYVLQACAVLAADQAAADALVVRRAAHDHPHGQRCGREPPQGADPRTGQGPARDRAGTRPGG